jgi:hypothetical protein
LIQQGAKRALPAWAQRWYAQRALEVLASMSWQIEQGVDLGDGHALGSVRDLDDLVASAYQPFLEHAQVEARSAV